MNAPLITTLYAGLLGLLSIAVAFQAGRLRGKLGIALGHGDSKELHLAMRRHANFAEYVPMALILIALLEANGVSHYAIHGLGAALVISRVCHAVGVQADTMAGPGRFVGAAGTALVTVIASVWAILVYF
jgi:uncharacterized membrane protein YecN with MAPEG domain